jgi:hypothetical protein
MRSARIGRCHGNTNARGPISVIPSVRSQLVLYETGPRKGFVQHRIPNDNLSDRLKENYRYTILDEFSKNIFKELFRV